MGTFEIVSSIALIVWSITTHEVAHGWVAYRLGDDTAKRMGRITLNPIPHIDPFLTVILPGLLLMTTGMVIGGARPVPVLPGRLHRPRRDMALVGAAGPVSNILIGFACAGLLAAFTATGLWTENSTGVMVLAIGVLANFFLAVFNLFPIPPLDGSRVVAYFLRGEAEIFWMKLERVGFLLILGIFFLAPGILGAFVFPLLELLLKAVDLVFGNAELIWGTVAPLLYERAGR